MTSNNEDQFPVGLKVLVVDDDTTCLKLIERLLLKCNYQVTTTNKAKEALRMLKENRKKFDIVISDVEMPDMDGIKLLQLVGLEMNIPVIMLSTYSDTKRVMQGIRNGACDYLVKPVRIQELQNIWQHVLRRKKAIPVIQGAPDAGGSGASAPGSAGKGKAPARDVVHDNKGKGIQESSGHVNNEDDDDDDDDDGSEDGGRDNDDPTAQKKPRFFWSVDVHQKFVDAVNQLGPDKAFPKKILDLMDVDGLTREKVASHLQKYRLYLRKVNNGSGQSGNRYGGFGAEDAHIGSLGGGYGVYRSLAGPGRFPGLTGLPDQTGGMLSRLNTAAGLSLRGLSSSPMLQTPQNPNSTNSFSTLGKFEPLGSSRIQNSSSMFQGINTTMQMNKSPLFCPPNAPMMLNGNSPLNTRDFSSQTSLISPSSNSLLDPNCRSNWETPGQPAAQPLSFPSNVLPTTIPSDGIAAASSQMQTDPLDIFCGISALDDSNRNIHNQDCLSALSNFSNIGQAQIWPDHKTDYALNPNNVSSTSSGLNTSTAPTAAENARKSNNSMMGASPFSQLAGACSQSQQQNDVQKSNNSEDILLDDPKLVCGAGQSSSEYLEDIVGRFLQQGNGDNARARDDLGLDPFLMQ